MQVLKHFKKCSLKSASRLSSSWRLLSSSSIRSSSSSSSSSSSRSRKSDDQDRRTETNNRQVDLIENNRTQVQTHYENRNLLSLRERGLIVSIFPDKEADFHKLVDQSVQSCYCGFDPTASSLHIGNLIALIVLLHSQRRGHTPVVLIGSATALIGDPSGKTKERNAIANENIIENAKAIRKNITKIFENHANFIWPRNNEKHKSQLRLPKILNNIDWYKEFSLIDFMSNYGRHFRMGDLLSRLHIENRIKSSEGLSFTEFSYQLFQSYDWLHLLRNEKCTIQLGGSDQMGNITTGHDLIARLNPKSSVFGITLPLVTNESGEKIGKTAGNAIWLDETLLSSYGFYQFFINTSDALVESYLKIFTFLPLNEIEDLMRKHRQQPEKFLAQQKLASQVTLLVHGESGLESAIKSTNALFYGDRESLARMSEAEIDNVFKSAKPVYLTLEPGMTVIDCVMKIKCFRNLDDSYHKIRSGGFRMNHTVITNPEEALIYGQHILNNNMTVIRVGKKSYHIIKWLS